MRIVLSTLAISLALVACGGEEKPAPKPEAPVAAPTPPPEPPKPVAFNAEETFVATCSPCHGTGGKGDGPAGAALDPKPANFTDAAFWATRDEAHVAKVIKEGGPSVGKSPLMAPFGGQFNDEQIAQLAAYVHGSFGPK